VILGIDEDCIVWTRRHARFAADADRFVKVDDAISSFEHCGGRAGSHTWRVCALIATSNLMRPSHLWKHTDVNMFYIGSGNRDRNNVFRLAGSCAGMAPDTTRVVDYFRPLYRLSLIEHRYVPLGQLGSANYITSTAKENGKFCLLIG
jgi:hypothetical protein